MIGRDAEIDQVIEILMRRRQNNPILIGDAGVGKTAIIEGLAQRIAAGQVPATLRQRVRPARSTSALLQAGASVSGEFEHRLQRRDRGGRGCAGRDASCSSTRPICCRAPAARRARPMPPTCSSRRWPVAGCARSRPRPGPNTSAISRRTRRSRGASSRSRSARPSVDDRRSSSCGSAPSGSRRFTTCGSPRTRWPRRRACRERYVTEPAIARQGDQRARHRLRPRRDRPVVRAAEPGGRRSPLRESRGRDRAARRRLVADDRT